MKREQAQGRKSLLEGMKAHLAREAVRAEALASVADLLPDGREKQWALGVRKNLEDVELVLHDLRAIDPNISSRSLEAAELAHPDVIRILISWVPRMANPNIRGLIIRRLTEKWAGRVAISPIFENIRHRIETTPPTDEREMIHLAMDAGNLVRALGQEDETDVVAIMRNPKTPRDVALTFLLSAGRIKGSRILETTQWILDQEDPISQAWALKALRRIRAIVDDRRVSELTTNSDPNVRKEATKTMLLLEKLRTRKSTKRAKA